MSCPVCIEDWILWTGNPIPHQRCLLDLNHNEPNRGLLMCICTPILVSHNPWTGLLTQSWTIEHSCTWALTKCLCVCCWRPWIICSSRGWCGFYKNRYNVVHGSTKLRMEIARKEGLKKQEMHPKACTNLSSGGMKRRATSAFTKCNWYRALQNWSRFFEIASLLEISNRTASEFETCHNNRIEAKWRNIWMTAPSENILTGDSLNWKVWDPWLPSGPPKK